MDSVFYFLSAKEVQRAGSITETDRFRGIENNGKLFRHFERRIRQKSGDLSPIFETIVASVFNQNTEIVPVQATLRADLPIPVQDGPRDSHHCTELPGIPARPVPCCLRG